MDPLWVKHLMEAFKNDDIELAQISFESSLSDVNDVVVGGESGSPYSIGDFGFYAEEQFEAQYNHVLTTTKQACPSKTVSSMLMKCLKPSHLC